MSDNLLLEVAQAGISFGGLRALSGVSLNVRQGEIFSVIGPNGSGKTTLFNKISGVYQEGEGIIRLKNRQGEMKDLTRLALYKRARLGLARTFQMLRLFEGMSVLDNVLCGFFQQQKVPWGTALWRSRKWREEEERIRVEAMELLGSMSVDLRPYAHQLSGSLPYAHRRRLEIIRALATRPTVLMLDEPAAAMSRQEAEDLARDLLALRDQGIGLLVIEHNMGFIRYLGGPVMVLSQGEIIAAGDFETVSNNPAVVSAYLGVPSE